VSLLAFRQQPQSSYEIARHDEATHGPRAKRYEVRSLWGLQAHPAPDLGTIQMEKAAWGVSGKNFGVAGARADPSGRR
jgi:hypothetical protein